VRIIIAKGVSRCSMNKMSADLNKTYGDNPGSQHIDWSSKPFYFASLRLCVRMF